ncbi:phage tail tape measure protein [Ochrobactrum sp. Kaboul]|nr:phage tail tape measure protein [Ochrobactrum sp. Kaboul]
MASRVATLRLQLIDSVSGPSKKSTEALKALESSIGKLGKNGVAGAKNLGSQLDYLRRKAAAVGDFKDLRRGAAAAFGEFRTARTRVKELEAALASVTKPTAKLNADMRSARSALKAATTAFQEQRAAARSAEQSLRSFSINSKNGIGQSQRAIRDQLAQTIRKMREMERENRKQPPAKPPRPGRSGPSVGGTIAGAAGGYATVRAGGVARNAFMDTVSYDQATAYRDALGYDIFSATDKARMNAQAEKIGYETRFTNADVVQSQVGVLQGGIRDANTIMNLLGPITDYALAMNVTLEEATETIRSSTQIRQIPMNDLKAVQKYVDNLVWMAKNGGMDDSDVRQYVRYGGGAMKSIGLSDPVANAMGVVLRRAGYKGDEAGVFSRTAAAKLGAPTNPGRIALQSMGLNFDDYVTQPEAFKVGGIAKMIQENFGIRVNKEMQDAITKYIDEGTFLNEDLGEEMPVGSDRGMFTSGIMDILEPLFGKMSAKDKKDVAKKLGDFHKFSAESVDSERLLMDILKSDPTIAQLNAFFTQRQGARAGVLSDRFPEFQQAIGLMQNTPEGITNKIGVKANEGLYGDYTRATGAVETALIKIVSDWEKPISSVLKSVDWLASEFTQLSTTTRRVIEALGALALAAGGYAAMSAGRGLLARILGGGAGAAAGTAGGAAAGAAGGGLLRGALRLGGRAIASPFGAGALTATALNQTDPEGNLWGLTSGVDAWVEKHTGINPSNVQLGRKRTPQEALEVDISQQTAQWPIAAQQGIREYIGVLMTGGAEAEAKAQATGEQIKEALTVNGALTIDTSQLERALGLARQFATVARGGSAAVSSSGGSLDPKLDGKRAGGGRVKAGGLYQINEKGQELFAPGADGTIIPNHKLGGGGVTVHAPINLGGITVGAGADTASVKAAVQQGVEQALAQLDAKLSRSLETTWSNLAYGDA